MTSHAVSQGHLAPLVGRRFFVVGLRLYFVLVCIHFTHADDHDFVLYCHIIGAGYIGHCVDGSFDFVTFQKKGKRRKIWLNAFSCKQWRRRSLKNR